MSDKNEVQEYEAKRKRLEMIHPKFANEHQCVACGGYFLNPDKNIDRCPRCIRLNRISKVEASKDILYKDVNVSELSKQVAELQAQIEQMNAKPEQIKPKSFKPKSCASCDKKFVPASPAQRICIECREELVK